jgi:hypothetical protein
MKKIASERASQAVKRSQIDLASESLTTMTYWPLPSVAARLVGAPGRLTMVPFGVGRESAISSISFGVPLELSL